MFYRVKIDLAFPQEKEARKAIEKAVEVFPSSVVINPDQDSQEEGSIQIEKCYHDEVPSKSCEIIFYKSNAPAPV